VVQTGYKKTWASLSIDDRHEYKKLTNIMNPNKSFECFRNILHTTVGPCVPFMESIVLEIKQVSLEYECPLPNGNLNLEKIKKIYQILSSLTPHKIPIPEIQSVEPLATYLITLPRISDEILHDLSIWNEPTEVNARNLPVLALGSFATFEDHGFSSSEVSEILELIVNYLLNDPRFIYMCKNQEKRLIMLRLTIGHMLRWVSKTTKSIYVAYEPNPNPDAPKKMCAVATWIEPQTEFEVPIAPLVVEFARATLKVGRSVAKRSLTMFQAIRDIIETRCTENKTFKFWNLFYYAITPNFQNRQNVWEHIFQIAFDKADAAGILCWTSTSDLGKRDFLISLGFEVDGNPVLLDNVVPVWPLVRHPKKDRKPKS